MKNSKSKDCRQIEDLLVSYAANELLPHESSKLTEHISTCSQCRLKVEALRKSLMLTRTIWYDNLCQIDDIQVNDVRPRIPKRTRPRWILPTAVAAAFLLAAGLFFTFHKPTIPVEQTTPAAYLATMERDINQANIAAKLFAATELSTTSHDTHSTVQSQYRYIAQTYPNTLAGEKAKSLLK